MFSLEFNPIPVSVLRDSPLHRLNVYNKVCFIIMSVLSITSQTLFLFIEVFDFQFFCTRIRIRYFRKLLKLRNANHNVGRITNDMIAKHGSTKDSALKLVVNDLTGKMLSVAADVVCYS